MVKMGGSIGNDRGLIDELLLEKTMVSGRVPKYVTKYAKEHKITIADFIMAGFDAYRENDLNHAFERLSYHEDRVIHWKQKLIHAQNERNTKADLCITIKEEFLKQGRGNPSNKTLDRNWLEPKIDSLRNQRIPITLDELYAFCLEK
jgi:hypothetical protein